MKNLPIPEDEQIRSLMERRFVEKIGEYVAQPRDTDYKLYFTVGKAKIFAYLKRHPKEAQVYFARWAQVNATHDVPKIWNEGSGYRVAWMDHGKPMSVEEYATLEEAVAEHVCMEFGLSND